MLSVLNRTAKAHIKGGKEFPRIDGIVSFKEIRNGIIVTAKINNLPSALNSCNRQVFWFSYP